MMPPGVLKRVRLAPSEARILAREAKERGVPEGEVLREMVRMMGRMRAREKNMHKLIALADLGRPDTEKFELR